MSSGRKDGVSCLIIILFWIVDHVADSNIITHHAEDGSGVGSAIIAGEWIIHPTHVITDSVAAMTKKRRDAGLYPNV